MVTQEDGAAVFRWAKQGKKEPPITTGRSESRPSARVGTAGVLAETPKPVPLMAEAVDDMLPSRFPPTREARYMLPRSGLPLRSGSGAAAFAVAEREEGEAEGARTLLYREPGPREKTAAVDQYAHYAAHSPFGTEEDAGEDGHLGADGTGYGTALPIHAEAPAWLFGTAKPATEAEEPESSSASPGVSESLQGSRERMASRWSALRGLFASRAAGPALLRPVVSEPQETEMPLLAVISLAGGAGKTSLLATLGRALSALGERVLLADLTTHGPLPYYFAAGDLRPSWPRTFSPPAGTGSAPMDLIRLNVESQAEAEDWLEAELGSQNSGVVRVLFDLPQGPTGLLGALARKNAQILIALAPDMNSLLSLDASEKLFAELQDGAGRAVQPFYLLNGFDAAQALHLDVREVLHQQLGDRLLPFNVRHSPAVPQALAEGMTVVDYAPKLPITTDYRRLAKWVRVQSPAAPAGRPVRRSER